MKQFSTKTQKSETEKSEDKKTEEDDKYYQPPEDFESTPEFKWYRRAMFLFGKFVKYTSWAAFAIFCYHMYLIKQHKTPEDKYYTNETFLRAARFIDWSIWDIKKVFTQPAMSKMLPDRFPGMQYPKVLVLNLKGTLVHQTYGLGVGVELFKRPGLSTFIYRMSRNYEVCIFGMGDAGEINEVCEALDPK